MSHGMNFKNFKRPREVPLDGEGGGVGFGVSPAGKNNITQKKTAAKTFVNL
jgi:hypothetical protein